MSSKQYERRKAVSVYGKIKTIIWDILSSSVLSLTLSGLLLMAIDAHAITLNDTSNGKSNVYFKIYNFTGETLKVDNKDWQTDKIRENQKYKVKDVSPLININEPYNFGVAYDGHGGIVHIPFVATNPGTNESVKFNFTFHNSNDSDYNFLMLVVPMGLAFLQCLVSTALISKAQSINGQIRNIENENMIDIHPDDLGLVAKSNMYYKAALINYAMASIIFLTSFSVFMIKENSASKALVSPNIVSFITTEENDKVQVPLPVFSKDFARFTSLRMKASVKNSVANNTWHGICNIDPVSGGSRKDVINDSMGQLSIIDGKLVVAIQSVVATTVVGGGDYWSRFPDVNSDDGVGTMAVFWNDYDSWVRYLLTIKSCYLSSNKSTEKNHALNGSYIGIPNGRIVYIDVHDKALFDICNLNELFNTDDVYPIAMVKGDGEDLIVFCKGGEVACYNAVVENGQLVINKNADGTVNFSEEKKKWEILRNTGLGIEGTCMTSLPKQGTDPVNILLGFQNGMILQWNGKTSLNNPNMIHEETNFPVLKLEQLAKLEGRKVLGVWGDGTMKIFDTRNCSWENISQGYTSAGVKEIFIFPWNSFILLTDKHDYNYCWSWRMLDKKFGTFWMPVGNGKYEILHLVHPDKKEYTMIFTREENFINVYKNQSTSYIDYSYRVDFTSSVTCFGTYTNGNKQYLLAGFRDGSVKYLDPMISAREFVTLCSGASPVVAVTQTEDNRIKVIWEDKSSQVVEIK